MNDQDWTLTEKDEREIQSARDEYDFDENCEDAAKARGQKVVLPLPNQLQIDIDNEEQLKEFERREESFATGYQPWRVSMLKTPSRSGFPACHITLTFAPERVFTDWERLALQSALGDDPIRAFLNTRRFFEGVKNPSRLFENI